VWGRSSTDTIKEEADQHRPCTWLTKIGDQRRKCRGAPPRGGGGALTSCLGTVREEADTPAVHLPLQQVPLEHLSARAGKRAHPARQITRKRALERVSMLKMADTYSERFFNLCPT